MHNGYIHGCMYLYIYIYIHTCFCITLTLAHAFFFPTVHYKVSSLLSSRGFPQPSGPEGYGCRSHLQKLHSTVDNAGDSVLVVVAKLRGLKVDALPYMQRKQLSFQRTVRKDRLQI